MGTALTDDENKDETVGGSVSSRAAALYFKHDPSLAALLVSHGIRVRDFIMLSFLSDQGPMTVEHLSRAVNIQPDVLMNGMKRLSAAGLVLREPQATANDMESMMRLTPRGQEVANRIDEQL